MIRKPVVVTLVGSNHLQLLGMLAVGKRGALGAAARGLDVRVR